MLIHLAGFLAACGAVDEGERDLPPPANPSKPKPEAPLENLFAVSGARPPKPGSPWEDFALHEEILADVARVIHGQPDGTVVVHGGAEGVDSAAGRAARERGLDEVVVRPWYEAWGKGAPVVRNAYVATCARGAFWPAAWSSPNGTPGAIGLARQAGVDVDERRV